MHYTGFHGNYMVCYPVINAINLYLLVYGQDVLCSDQLCKLDLQFQISFAKDIAEVLNHPMYSAVFLHIAHHVTLC